MDQPGTMKTLSEVLEKLRKRRHDNEFKLTENGFTVNESKMYVPEDLTIIKSYRFEGDSNPDDSCVLYLIQANDGLIGYSIDAYGAYSNHEDEHYDDFIRRMKVEDRDEQIIFGSDQDAPLQ
ncbi:MAG: hypothetical protein U0T73_01120 [Chitinophagales bacterium]